MTNITISMMSSSGPPDRRRVELAVAYLGKDATINIDVDAAPHDRLGAEAAVLALLELIDAIAEWRASGRGIIGGPARWP